MVIITEDGKKARVKKNEFYETPFSLASKMVSISLFHVNALQKNFYILDAGCGRGVFGKACRKMYPDAHIAGIDIDGSMIDRCATLKENDKFTYDFLTDGDYLDMTRYTNYDLIIGNPPFSLAEKFIRKSISMLTDNGALMFLLRLNFLGSQKRVAGLWKDLQLSSLYVLNARVSFFDNGKSDDNEHGIYIWNKKDLLEPFVPKSTSLHWIKWR